MAVSKCALCNGRLRGGDWKYKEINGKAQKVCVDERACNLRKRMKELREQPDDDGKADAAVKRDEVSYTGVVVITTLQFITFGAGVIVGMLVR